MAKKKSKSDAGTSKAIRRAIRKSDPTHELPIVGKPVIIDPAEEKAEQPVDDTKPEASKG